MFNGSAYVLEIDLANTCREVSQLPVEATSVLRLFDGRRGLSEVLDDSPLEVPKTLKVVQRLASQGLVRLAKRNSAETAERERWGRRRLDAEVRQWLGVPDPRPAGIDDLDESGLEAALEAALGGVDPDRHDNQNRCVPLEAIPDAMEQSLEKTLMRCTALQDLLESHLESMGGVAHDDLQDVLLPASGAGTEPCDFSALEEEFFDSYVPDEVDGDLEEILEEIGAEARLPACTE